MRIKTVINEVRYDLKYRGATFKKSIRLFFIDQSFRLILNYRIGKSLYNSRFRLCNVLAEYYKIKQITKRNSQISFKAQIGYGVKFPHPLGIVIGEGVIIKNNVKIWQQVTIGSHGKKGEILEYPIIEEGVKIFAGAKIFGGITIGENAVIGANAVVFVNVPPHCTAVGNPARIINKNLE